MKRFLLLLPLLWTVLAFANFPNTTPATHPEANLAQGKAFLTQATVLFEENKGQITGTDANQVRFTYKQGNFSAFLLQTGISYQFQRTHFPENYPRPEAWMGTEDREAMRTAEQEIRIETYRMDVRLVDANPHAAITTEGKGADYTNYYNHNALEVYGYEKITYHEVYPHIDWVIFKSGDHLKYEFVVRPGGNPKQIQLQTKWVEDLSLNPDGSLDLKNSMGSVTEQKPISFQDSRSLATNFLLDGDKIRFEVAHFDPSKTLVIDPSLVWGSYYGGVNWDTGNSCSTDAAGNVYLGGITLSATGIAAGGYQNTFGGGTYDAFLVKFSPSGVRLWGTYYGGEIFTQGYSCTTDADGNVYLAGVTNSATGIAFGGHQNTLGGNAEGFLVKFNPSGVRLWATYYGGENEDYGRSCTTDSDGNVYLAGYTRSTTGIAFGGHQNTNGGYDGFLAKFSPSGVRLWGTYYGGTNLDHGYGCTTDADGNVYLAGETFSTTGIASGGHQNTKGGDWDGFLVKFNPSGVRLWGTFYGGVNTDKGNSCTTDAAGNVYLAGGTNSATGIAFGGHQNMNGEYDGFLAKFSPSGVRLWGTYYGGENGDYGYSCTTDFAGNVYLAGVTNSTTGIAFVGHQSTYGGNLDAFLVKFNPSGVRLWASYYGGENGDWGNFCTADAASNVYLAGYSQSTMGIASGGHQNTIGGDNDAFLVKFSQSPCSDPDAQEICGDGIDNDCDGIVDENCPIIPCSFGATNVKGIIQSLTEVYAIWEGGDSSQNIIQVSYRLKGATSWVNRSSSSDTELPNNSLALRPVGGFIPDTLYDLRVRFRCPDLTWTPYSDTAVFSTYFLNNSTDCRPTSTVGFTYLKANGQWLGDKVLVLTDKRGGGSTTAKPYFVSWKPLTAATWFSRTQATPKYNLTSLTPNTDYTYRWRTWCDATNRWNAFVVDTFKTLPAPPAPFNSDSFSRNELDETVAMGSAFVFPNPADDFVHIFFDNGEKLPALVRVFDTQNRLIASLTPTSDLERLDISRFSAGAYMVLIIQENQSVVTQKFVKF